MQGSARKDVVFGAARVYTFTVPGPKWKSWLRGSRMAATDHHKRPSADEPNRRVRFGPFEADLRAGELRKYGIRIKLAEQPFRILARLIERPGDVVTREELIELLWPAGTYVEFDHSLNAAIKKLRRALNDSPGNPKFIQTLPKRGYRFVARVEAPAEAEPASPEAEGTRGRRPVITMDAARVAPTALPWVGTRSNARRIAAVAAGVIIALGALALLRETTGSDEGSSVEAGPVRLKVRSLAGLAGQTMLPALSPDGKSVAFSWNGGEGSEDPDNLDIYVQRIDGGSPVRITTSPGRDLGPSWSPDGFYIASSRHWPAPAPGAYLLSLRDGSETRIMGATRGSPSWTPDGNWLVGSEEGRIVAVSIETRERRELGAKADGASSDSFAVVSPDGKLLAFARCVRNSSCDLYVQPFKGGQPRQLTFDKGSFAGLAWTPDSEAIVYALEGRIYRMTANGRRSPQPVEFLSNDPLLGRLNSPTIARFATNGSSRMIFRHTRVRDADVWETDITESAGVASSENPRKVIDSPGLDWRPAYSPDGQYIAFESRESRNYQLWICGRDGTNRKQLTDSTYRMGNLWPPAWSPDGSQIAFRASTPSDQAYHIYTAAVDGGVPRRVTVGEDETAPGWSRDGLWVYFLSKRSGQNEIWKAPSNGSGPAVPVNNTLSWSYAESPDGRFVYFCGAEKKGTPYGSLHYCPADKRWAACNWL